MADVPVGDLNRASVMIDLGRFDDAASLLGSVLASSPGSSRGWCLLSRAHLGSGNAPEAVAAAARASALDPADDWPYRLASTALMAIGQTAGAVSAARQARSLAPQYWRSHVCLAQAATTDGDHELAAQAAAAAVALAPDVADVHVAAGTAALARGDVTEARHWQESALAIEPTHSGAINELGRISLSSRNPAAAAAYFLRAASTSPGTGVFRRNTELALSRVAVHLIVRATLMVALGTCIIAAGVVRSFPLAVVLGLLLIPLAMGSVGEFRRLPPGGRNHLLRLFRARWAQAGHRIKKAATRGLAALVRRRSISSNVQARNEAAGS